MSAPPVLSARGVSRAFGPVPVLHGINLDLRPGAVLGENGAGKSTPMKILAGQIEPSAGTLHVEGRPVAFAGIREAEAHGIALIHQELNLAPHLSVAANIFLGRELRRGPFLHEAAMLAAGGCALLLAGNESVSASYDTGLTELGQGDLLGLLVPAWIAVAAYLVGAVAMNLTAWGRTMLAVGGSEEATRLIGLPADRTVASVYVDRTVA